MKPINAPIYNKWKHRNDKRRKLKAIFLNLAFKKQKNLRSPKLVDKNRRNLNATKKKQSTSFIRTKKNRKTIFNQLFHIDFNSIRFRL